MYGKKAGFVDFQADVGTTYSKFEEDVNDGRHEVTSVIDDLFVDDNNLCFCYQLQNVSKTPDEAINDFLINDETASDKVSSYCQESSSDDEDKIDNFPYSKNKIDAFKETPSNPKDLTEDSLVYAICCALRHQKSN